VFDRLAHAEPLVGKPTAKEQALADRMSATWAAFARTGVPDNPKIPHWPAYDTTRRATMVIDDQWRVADDPLGPTRTAIAELQKKYAQTGPG
jgi:para-nitrobenzyl esterase